MNPTANSSSSTQVTQALSGKESGVICLAPNAGLDSIAAALALAAGLNQLGKSVVVVSESPVKADLPGVDTIQSTLATSGNNLVISLPYSDGAIDKVDYNIQGSSFNLIIQPKEGSPKITANDVQYSYTGGSVDFVITIDVSSLKALGGLYQNNQKQFDGNTIINVDRRLTNSYFGTVNLVNKTSSSTSEIILNLLQGLQVRIDAKIATNLYAGIMAATNNVSSYSVNAKTFETLAALLKLGAAKRPMTPRGMPQNMGGQQFQSPMKTYANTPEIEQIPSPVVKPAASEVESAPSKDATPIEEVEVEKQAGDSNETPDDWLKPKIFKGGSNLI